jgi:hypothetical protein
MPEDGLLGEGIKEDKSGGAYFSKDKVSFGAMGDSTYEYVIPIQCAIVTPEIHILTPSFHSFTDDQIVDSVRKER